MNKATDLGYSPSLALYLLHQRNRMIRTPYKTVVEFVDDILDAEEQMRAMDIGSTEEFVAMKDTAFCLERQANEEEVEEQVATTPPFLAHALRPPSPPARADASTQRSASVPDIRSELSEEISKLKEEVCRIESRVACVICLTKERQFMFVPCGHLCCCMPCSKALQKCPICRRRIIRCQRVHLS